MKILECRDRNQQLVVPIFYKIDKSDVEKQKKSFSVPFEVPEVTFPGVTADEISSWKAALATASNILGYVVNESRLTLLSFFFLYIFCSI